MEFSSFYPDDKPALYTLLKSQLEALALPEEPITSNLANAAALLFAALKNINWAGFYLMRGEELLLGPFQGKTACVRIPRGKGVCGTAAAKDEAQLVADVHLFPGHIACDSASNSELVVPLIKEGRLIGVLDLDSPCIGRFTEQDQQGIEALAAIFMRLSEC